MVTIWSVGFTSPTRSEHERITSPLICTEQAPHCATPQPYFVPVRPTCSRRTQSRGVSASTSTSRVLPLILSFAIEPPPDPSNGFLIGDPGTRPAPRPCRNIAQAATPCLRQFASSLKCDRLNQVTRCHGTQSLKTFT